MKNIILFTYIVLLSSSYLIGQNAIRIKPESIKKQVTIELDDVDYEEVLKATITNTGDRAISLLWDKVILYQPHVWESQICDKEASYPPNVTSNVDLLEGIKAPNVLEAGESFDLFLTILPFNTTGQCKIEVPFRDINHPNKVLGTASFQLNLIDSNSHTAANRFQRKKVKIYPNPVHDRFFLNNAPKLGRLEIYNGIGQRVKVYDSPQPNDSYDAADLPQGVYLLSLINESGKVIRTMRLLRRDFRP